MSQTPEVQRAIIAGVRRNRPDHILEVRTKLVVPEKITLLEASGMQFALDGMFDKNGYCFFGKLHLPMKDEYRSLLSLQPEPEDNPKLISLLEIRWIILKDGRVYRRYPSPDQKDSDKLMEKRYRRENLVIDKPFNFEATWNRVERQLKGLAF